MIPRSKQILEFGKTNSEMFCLWDSSLKINGSRTVGLEGMIWVLGDLIGLCSKLYVRGLPKDTSPGRGMSYLAWQEHNRSFAPSSADGGVQPACISLVFSGIQAMESFSKGEPFVQGCPAMCQMVIPKEQCQGSPRSCALLPMGASFLPTENQAIKWGKAAF